MTAKRLTLAKWQLPPPPDASEDSWRIGLLSDPDDYHVCLLASLGMTYDVISRQTGLSKGQISYRLRKANYKRVGHERIASVNYRNGTSKAAAAVIALASRKVADIINPQLRKTLALTVDI